MERTMMSWLRSTLALIVGITVTMHQVAPDFGVVPASLLGLVGTALSIVSYSTAHARFIRSGGGLPNGTRFAQHSSLPLLLLALAAVVGGLCATLFAARMLLM
ncbi:DUF202 domain-containing protein [Leucobacter sp. L43]|uniref:DUF202 domain-containing protein n=1 Tax=Leucobacter sp. L43 TaxID=2798040 RepID=UPI002107A567|nr:DUF202 domain-containing protein [Leucobacter sp. L43]